MKRDDILLITFPFSDLASTKVRPALVLSEEKPTEQDIIVALISSNTYRTTAETDYLLSASDADFSDTGLKTDSVFRMSKLHNLNKSLAKRRLGRVNSHLMKILEKRLRLALGLKS